MNTTYQYMILKMCTKLKNKIINECIRKMNIYSQVDLVEINVPIDIINNNSFKNSNIKRFNILTYEKYKYDIIYEKYKTYKTIKRSINHELEKIISDYPCIITMMFSLNSEEFTLKNFEDIIEKYNNKVNSNVIIVGSIYNDKIKPNENNYLYFSYNLYTGNKLENKIKEVKEKEIKEIIDKYENLDLTFYNFNELQEQNVLEYNNYRKLFIINHKKHFM